METVALDPRFNGPPASANGGYACGVVAGLLASDQARVSLRLPPPLGQELNVIRDGTRVELRDGDRTVADGVNEELALEATEPVDPQRAAAASRDGYERWSRDHPFPSCFVCGPARQRPDGLRVFPGPLADGRYAAAWTPDVGLADADGAVRAEYVWAALDCPTSAPIATFGEGQPVVLAQLHAHLQAPVRAGEPHALVSWRLGVDGRKRQAACTLFDPSGRLLASSRALWIELRTG